MTNVEILREAKAAFDKLISSCYKAEFNDLNHEFEFDGVKFDLRMDAALDVVLHAEGYKYCWVIFDDNQLEASIRYPELYF